MMTLAIFSVAVCLANPAFAQMGRGGGGGANEPIDPQGDNREVEPELPPDPEGKAEELRLAGKCQEAIPIFRRLAARGDGFEVPQYNLGLCLLDVSKTEPDAQRAASLKQEGAALILKAAKHNLPRAQARLAELYLDGDGVAPDPVEAGMWALIYHANGARFALGLPNISAPLQARLDGALTAASWAVAQSRADAWIPEPQENP